MNWLYVMPTWLCTTLALILIAGGSAIMHWFLHQRGWRGFREHNDIVGFILTIVGAIYAVVLGFVAVVVWEQYEGARQNEQREINALSAMYALAEAYPTQSRDELRHRIVTYARLVVDEEWPEMRWGQHSVTASNAARRLVNTIILLHPSSRSAVVSETLSLAHTVAETRETRLQDNRSGIPPLLWIALLGGGIITIGFGYLFGIENEWLHAVATACTAGIIALMLVLIARLDFPFRGDTGIPPSDWQAALSSFMG